tara:strand:+ start:218 stop:1114 length:897 start_codon:yes stop_codon:yes gene_type:complete
MNTTPTKLNIYDLYRDINEKKDKKNISYNQVLYKIHDKIKRAAEKEKYKFVYEIPEVVFGLPSYDLNMCIAYIMKQLRSNGFLVKYYFPKILYISWDPREIRDYKKQKTNIKNSFKQLSDKKSKIDNQVYDPRNYYTPKQNQQGNINSNIDFSHQEKLAPPITTKYNNAIFKPMLNYDPNNIPTYNYYAYSTLNNNLINDNFYINNKPDNFNKYNGNANNGSSASSNNVEAPEHFKKLQLKQLQIQNEEIQKTEQFNNNYQKDIIDYYNNDNEIETEHPFKNTIKKYNSKGKFVLDLT